MATPHRKPPQLTDALLLERRLARQLGKLVIVL